MACGCQEKSGVSARKNDFPRICSLFPSFAMHKPGAGGAILLVRRLSAPGPGSKTIYRLFIEKPREFIEFFTYYFLHFHVFPASPERPLGSSIPRLRRPL